jgi:hypothetical protein
LAHHTPKKEKKEKRKKVETVKVPQKRKFHGKMKYLSLWPSHIGEKRRTLGKTYGIKAKCYWEHPWGTHWEPSEHIENLKGTCWEKNKKKKYYPTLPPPPPKTNWKQIGICLAHFQLKMDGLTPLHIYIFFLISFFQHHPHKQIFNIFFTNLHFIFYSISIHFKFIIELN